MNLWNKYGSDLDSKDITHSSVESVTGKMFGSAVHIEKSTDIQFAECQHSLTEAFKLYRRKFPSFWGSPNFCLNHSVHQTHFDSGRFFFF